MTGQYEVSLRMRLYLLFRRCQFIYANVYLKYAADFAEGSYLRLAVVIAKENGCVVSACAESIGKIVDRLCILPEYPENIGCVCNRFFFLMLRKYEVIVFGNEGNEKMF